MAKKKKNKATTLGSIMEEKGELKTLEQVEKENEAIRKQAQDRRIAQAKEKKKLESQARTDSWKKLTQELTYDNGQDNSFQAYAAKQITDSHAWDRYNAEVDRHNAEIKRRNNEIISQNTKQWRDLSQQATYAGAPEMAYAGKMISDTKVSKDQEEKYGQNARQMKYNDFINELRKSKEKKTARSGSGVRMQKSGDELLYSYLDAQKKKLGGNLGTEEDLSPTEAYSKLPEEKKAGLYRAPKGNDVNDLLNYNKARQYINTHPYDLQAAQRDVDRYTRETEAYTKQVNQMHDNAHQQVEDYFSNKPYNDMGSVFDFVRGWDINNEQAILDNETYNGTPEHEKAQGLWDELNSTKDADKQNVLDRAENFFRYDYDPNMFEDGEDPEIARRALYDAIMPDTYDERIGKLRDNEKLQLDSMLDSVLQRAKTEKNYVPEEYEQEYQKYLNQPEVLAAEKRMRYSNDKLEEAQANEKFIQSYQHFMNDYYRPQAPNFIPENDQGGTAYNNMNEMERGVRTNDVHRIYSFINGGKEFQSWAGAMRSISMDPQVTDEYSYAGLMNDQEIQIFNDFYNRGEYEQASRFLDGLNSIGALSRRYSEYESIRVQEASKQLPVLSSIASQMMTMADTYMPIVKGAAGLLGDKTVSDPYGKWYAGSRQSNEIQNAIAQELGDYGSKIYLNSMNSIRNVVNGLMTRGLGFTGAAQTAASLGMFASQIYQESTYKYLTETHDFDKARGLAALDAMMETLEEMLPYEAMLENYGGRPFMALLMNGLSEMGEEVTGATIGDRIRGVITGRDSLQKRADEIFAKGGYYQGDEWIQLDSDTQKALNQADMQAIREWGDEVKESALGGLFGGTLGGAYSGITYKASEYGTGRRISSENNTTEEGKTGIERIIEIGSGMKTNTESYKLAKELEALTKQNKKPSNFQLGKLAQNIYEESGGEMGNAATKVVEDRAYSMLDGSGMNEREQHDAAQLIAKAVMDRDSMSREEKRQIKNDPNLNDVYETFLHINKTTLETRLEQAEATRPAMAVRENVSELLGIKKNDSYALDITERLASEDEIKKAKGERVQGNEVVVDGNFGEITKADFVEATEEDQNETGRKTQAVFTVTVNGEERTLTASQLKATGFGTAAIVREASQNPDLYSKGYVNAMLGLQKIGQAKNAGTFLSDAYRIRFAGLTGQAMPQTSMDKAAAEVLFKQSQEDRSEYLKEQLKDAPEVKSGQGHVKLDGVEYDTDEWKEKIKTVGNRNLREQIEATAAILKMAGIHGAELYTNEATAQKFKESEEEARGRYGWESKKGGIGINIGGIDFGTIDKNGKFKKADGMTQHHLLVTLGHEMTHWLQHHSDGGYKQLEQVVFNELNSKNINIGALVEAKMSSLGIGLNEAIDEVVADSCDQILGSEEFRKHIQQTDKGLYQKIQGFVKDLVNRVSKAIKNMGESRSLESYYLANSMNKIAKAWLGAFDETLSGVVAEGMIQEAEENPVDEFKMSRAIEMREDGLIAQHNIKIDNLRKCLKMGGIPMPSIGIVNQSMSWTKFGEVSLFFGRDIVDRAINQKRAYRGDAYTPMLRKTNPQTENEAMSILHSQPERQTAAFHHLYHALGTLHVNSIDEMRAKAQRATEENNSAEAFQKKTEKMEQDEKAIWDTIVKEAKVQDRFTGISDIKEPFIQGIMRGIEQIYENNITDESDKRELLRSTIAEECDKVDLAETYAVDLDMNKFSNDVLDQIIEYAENFDAENARSMQEIKPDEFTHFADLKAIELPNNTPQDIIDGLIEAGVSEENIHYYEAENEQDRVKVMNEIKDETPEVRFSKAEKEYKFHPDFESDLRLFVNNNKAFKTKYNAKDELVIGETFQVLQDIGIDNKPMTINQAHLAQGLLNPPKDLDHKLTPKQLTEIIKRANNPVAVIESISQNHQNDSLVLIVDYKLNNNTVIVPVRISTTARSNQVVIDVNRMASAYGKGGLFNLLKQAMITELSGQRPGIYYTNKNKADYLRKEGVQFPLLTKNNGLRHMITDNPYFVKQQNRNPKTTQNVMNQMHFSRAQLDSEYQAAVESGDLAHAEEMLLEKLQRTDGIIAFNAPHGYAGQHKDIAKMIKDGTPEVVARAAADMAQYVPDNAVLIPIPPHEGTVTESTDTMILARAIGELTGRPVVNALGSNKRESRYQAKSENRKGVSAEEMGFRQIADIPEGTMPIFIDNVVGSGETAKAARNALGGGITLSYAKSTRSQGIAGLKRATVTYDKEGKLIPLSQRFDVSKRDTRYSKANLAELDQRYMDAYNTYDDEEGEKVIAEMAELAMPDSKVRDENGKLKIVYHQTNADPFTVFDMDKARQTEDVVGAFFAPEFDRYHEYGDRTYAVYLNITNPAYDVYDMDLSQEEAGLKKRNELIAQGYDGVINTEDGKVIEYVAFYPEQIKSAEAFTEDDDGDLIPLVQRFNRFNQDIRFSKAGTLTGEQRQEVDRAEENGINLDITNHTASKFSRASYMRSEYYKDPETMAKMLARNVLGKETKANIAKAKKWIADVTSICALIGDKSDILDYVASPGRSSFKSNPEYGGSIDSSTICAKRRLQTGTIDAIQRAMPNYVMTAEDFLQIRRMMKQRNYEVSCGLCFVESSRKNIAKYASQFMREWNSEHPDNKVNMTQINTVLGLENTRINNKEVYDAYEKFMNKLAQRKPKLFEMRSEYDNDIIKHFRNDDSVSEKNKRGGMRINSFSDFEIVHLIDMMQVIMDMSNVGLAGQAYTKVREFAEALGPTGLKINMSMIAAGVDENGRIVFDEVEGMKWADVEDLRDKYPDNVGTVCVVFTEDQLFAAMADDRIDFIIPFHRSQWNKSNYKDIGLPDNVKDFTYWQNERYAKPVYGTKKDGTKKKLRATNYMPNEYWDFSKSGKENAEIYLEKCKKENKIPKFWKWLQSNGDGSFSLKADGSTDGYWKLLGDFKMYNHLTGKGAEQMAVKPEFDMAASERMLNDYKGGHDTFPVAEDVVSDFVKEKTKGRKGITKKNGKIKLAGPEIENTRFSKATHESMDVGSWMMGQTMGSVQTEAERQLLQDYRDLRIKISLSIKRQLDYKEKIRRLESREAELTPAERNDLMELRNKLQIQQDKQADLEDKLYKVTAADGWAGMMYHNNIVLNDFILGKTQDQVRESVEQMVDQVKAAEKIIAQQAKALRKMADSQAVKAVSSMIDKKTLNYAVKSLKDTLQSSMGKKELESRLTEMALKLAAGEDITQDARELATDMTNRMRGYQNDVLERMRGVTIIIGPDQQKEMKGNGMTLASVREQLKGTGVKVKYGDFSSLDTDTVDGGDLRTLLPELPPDIGENSGDALFRFISWAQSMRDTDTAMKQQMVDIEDTAMSAIALASTIKVGENTAEYQKQNQMAAQTRKMAEDLEQAGKTLTDETDLAGKRAVGMASVLQRDVHEAIKYYNTIARMAAQEEKAKVKKNVIEQLKSQHTADLIKQQMKYQDMMKQERQARAIAEDNKSLRNQINTVAKRVRKRILEETDQKNIPEMAKPLARQMLKMLVQHDYVGYRHVLLADREQLDKTMKALDSYDRRDGAFNPDEDLKWLIVGSGEDADYDIHDKVVQDLIDIEQGLLEYRTAEGQGKISLEDRRQALRKISRAAAQIWSIIDARANAEINGRRMLVNEIALQANDDMGKSRFKGELTGAVGRALGRVKSFVVNGNTTPEYFFKNLRNTTLSQLYDEYHRAENRNGLEVGRAQRRIAEIAEKYGYKNWDPQKRYTIQLEKGGTVNLTLGEMMSLYATWEREVYNQTEMNGPEESNHLKVGGFYTQQEEKAKILGREIVRQRAHRLTEEDMARIKEQMTEEQLDYVRDMVSYMTKDIGALGNEASMRMYGIKKYNEKWYFPFEIWSGVKSVKSDQGAAGTTENRIAHSSFSKRRVNNANNALVIRDFTETAIKHIGQMINYNTFAPAIEFMNRVMNEQLVDLSAQVQEGDLNKKVVINADNATKRNLRAAFIEAYGREAMDYFDNFQKDINGGVKQADRTPVDKLLSTFKKSAVAGSLSVTAQQPLSIIRAAMMIKPKYLATSINLGPKLKQIAEEMRKYSGVAVIKDMGKFDMNFGQSAQDYMTPDAMKSKGKAVYDKISDLTTIAPELMDTWTWCNIWEAVKKEQKAQNPGMDVKSDEFLNMVAERFNDVMRKTQVYDSILVKSRNMRSQHWWMKGITSFMAEPTLTLNVLADAVANVAENGGKGKLAKACTTFVISAIMQAIVKGLISAGRNPKDKETFLENAAYRATYSLISELNPISLIPGYSDLITVFKNGELTDDAMSVIGNMLNAVKTGKEWIFEGKGDAWKSAEDSIGMLTQLFTNIPLRNLSRDVRAIRNYIENPYAKRPTSATVLKNQFKDQFMTADNMLGTLNEWFGFYGTKNTDYYNRIYEADKAGKQSKVSELVDYLKLARGVSDKKIQSEINTRTKADKSLSEAEKAGKLIEDNGGNSGGNYVMDLLKKGEIKEDEARKLLKKAYPDKTDDWVWWKVDRAQYEAETGADLGSNDTSYRLDDAIATNRAENINKAVKQMKEHGATDDSISIHISREWKPKYLAAKGNEKIRMKDALTKALKAAGLTEQKAVNRINNWK